jgi:hypothetical protein
MEARLSLQVVAWLMDSVFDITAFYVTSAGLLVFLSTITSINFLLLAAS